MLPSVLASLAPVSLMPQGAQAISAVSFTPVTQSGTIATDDEVVKYDFSLISTQTLYFYTTSYAGGLNADGTTAPSEGFDPILTLSDGSGAYVNSNDEDTALYNRPDTAENGPSLDAFFVQTLAAGSYSLRLTEYDNVANGTDGVAGNLGQGFSRVGQGNFTTAFGGRDATGGVL